MAGDGARGEPRLVGGVLHRFQPHIGAGLPVAVAARRRRWRGFPATRAAQLRVDARCRWRRRARRSAASSALGTTPMPTMTMPAGDALAGRGHRRRRRAPSAPSSRATVVRGQDAHARRLPAGARHGAATTGATARPSSRSCASSTVTRRPPAASVAAISSPMKPPPRTTTSSALRGAARGWRAHRPASAATARRRAARPAMASARGREPVARMSAVEGDGGAARRVAGGWPPGRCASTRLAQPISSMRAPV